MLRMDRQLYNAIGEKLNSLIGKEIGELTATKRSPMFRRNDLISFSYVFKEDKDIYLYIKDMQNIITLEMKDFSKGRSETRFRADMSRAKELIIEMFEKITKEETINKELDILFSAGKVMTEDHRNGFGNMPF